MGEWRPIGNANGWAGYNPNCTIVMWLCWIIVGNILYWTVHWTMIMYMPMLLYFIRSIIHKPVTIILLKSNIQQVHLITIWRCGMWTPQSNVHFILTIIVFGYWNLKKFNPQFHGSVWIFIFLNVHNCILTMFGVMHAMEFVICC